MNDVQLLRKQLKKLRSRLADSEQTLEAIRTGKVDALMVFTSKGEQVYTLRGAERPYRVMVEQMAEGAVTFGRDGMILFCNHRFAELLGKPPEQIVGSQLFDYLPQAQRLPFQEILHGVNGVAGRTELQLVAGDGRMFPVNVSVTSLELEESSDAFSMVVNNLEEQRRLERQVLEVSEREQLRLGQDLHDGLGQVLAGVSFMLQSIPPAAREHPKEFTRAKQLLNDALHQTRELAKGFYPVELERHGLAMALQELAVNTKNMFRIDCHVTRNKLLNNIDKNAQIHLFRLIQESIRNAVRHGQAKSIHIKAERVGKEIVVSIENDGLRFPLKNMRITLVSSQGMGLKIMHYRARLIGGSLEFTPGRKSGCVIRCTIPLSKRVAR